MSFNMADREPLISPSIAVSRDVTPRAVRREIAAYDGPPAAAAEKFQVSVSAVMRYREEFPRRRRRAPQAKRQPVVVEIADYLL